MFIQVNDNRYVNSDNIKEFRRTNTGWTSRNMDATTSDFNGEEGVAVEAFLQKVDRPLMSLDWAKPLQPGGMFTLPEGYGDFSHYPMAGMMTTQPVPEPNIIIQLDDHANMPVKLPVVEMQVDPTIKRTARKAHSE